ncbi:hypothetical protein TH61_03665 [Rufibacter sp. DG15C]|uniref:porin family protein n=1 Tax=Rufibacter sp. DG15C TaxID=1379909 RepID=UPI00078EF50B|nr:porin family protein [Rufibacter sp. DG15C]AMM50462.1 hypothetical protein TH61_03665 [Rufibacter sp. DG15C]
MFLAFFMGNRPKTKGGIFLQPLLPEIPFKLFVHLSIFESYIKFYNMKNLILTLSLVIIASASGLAQQAPGTLQLGIVAGPTHTFVRGNDNIKTEADFRKAVGISGQYQFNKFFLKTNVLYENKGYVINYPEEMFDTSDPALFEPTGDGIYTVDFRYHYITVPILVGAYLRNTGLFVSGGAYGAYLLKDDLKTERGDKQEIERDKKIDLGVVAGIGYEHALSTKLVVSAEVRHNLGLANNSENKDYPVRNNSTNLLFGLHYKLTAN